VRRQYHFIAYHGKDHAAGAVAERRTKVGLVIMLMVGRCLCFYSRLLGMRKRFYICTGQAAKH